MIDMMMTSVIRPGLYKETLDTIDKHVLQPNKNYDFRLILNVDPVGESFHPKVMVKTAKNYFGDIVCNIPDKPSFPLAVKWLWQQSTADFAFHWEDDVFIYRKINLDHMIDILTKHDKLSSLRLSKFPTKRKRLNIFSAVWEYKQEGFYLANRWQEQFGLNPILIKKDFVSEAASLFVDNRNPEKQFRVGESMDKLIRKWQYGLYSKPGEEALIWGKKGEAWKKKHGFFKGKVAFTSWAKRGK